MKITKPVVVFLIILIVSSLLLISSVYFKYTFELEFHSPQEKSNILLFNPTVSDMVIGNPDASITIVAYLSFDCSSCENYLENLYPYIMDQYIETGKVKYYHKFFLSVDDIDQKSDNYMNALYGYCLFNEDSEIFWENYGSFRQDNRILNVSLDCISSTPEAFQKDARERIFYGIHAQPVILVGINNNANTLITGVPTQDQLDEIIRNKEILLGMP